MHFVVILAACVAATVAHPYYADLIPNGYAVPDPCGGGTWLAVGHYNAKHHTIDKNPFGQDFAAAGHTWSKAVCEKDSDGDGVLNGEELGDPDCVWTPGATPATVATGHPGICNPVGSCAQSSYSCNCHGHNCVG